MQCTFQTQVGDLMMIPMVPFGGKLVLSTGNKNLKNLTLLS